MLYEDAHGASGQLRRIAARGHNGRTGDVFRDTVPVTKDVEGRHEEVLANVSQAIENVEQDEQPDGQQLHVERLLVWEIATAGPRLGKRRAGRSMLRQRIAACVAQHQPAADVGDLAQAQVVVAEWLAAKMAEAGRVFHG